MVSRRNLGPGRDSAGWIHTFEKPRLSSASPMGQSKSKSKVATANIGPTPQELDWAQRHGFNVMEFEAMIRVIHANQVKENMFHDSGTKIAEVRAKLLQTPGIVPFLTFFGWPAGRVWGCDERNLQQQASRCEAHHRQGMTSIMLNCARGFDHRLQFASMFARWLIRFFTI